MKKLATLILLLVYSTFSAGAMLHLHYCNGEFVGTSLLNTNSGVCSKCKMEKHSVGNKCCKDIKVSLKISDKHFSPAFTTVSERYPAFYQQHYFTAEPIHLASQTSDGYYNYNPPDHSTPPLFIKNRNVRI